MLSEDELYHAWLKKGEKPKYVAKVPIGKGKYRYFYSNLEYKAYLTKKKLVSRFEHEKRKIEKSVKEKLGIHTVVSTNLTKHKNLGKKLSDIVGSMSVTAGKAIVEAYKTKAIKDVKYIAKTTLPNGIDRYFYDKKGLDSFYRRQKYQEDEPDFMEDVPEIDSDGVPSAEEDMSEINEGYLDSYENGDAKRTQNCRLCTVAYEMRRRGYDVEAADYSDYTRETYQTLYDLEKIYKKPVINKSSTTEVVDTLSKQKNTRGELVLYWHSGGAHSVAYEVNGSGEVIFRDCQTNTVYQSNDGYRYRTTHDYLLSMARDVYYTRTDNLEFSKGAMECVRNN